MLGTLSLSLEGEVLTTVDLLASHDVEASGLLLFWRNVRNFFSSTAVKVVGIALLVLAAALIVWKLTVGRRRYRYGRSVPGRGAATGAGGGIDTKGPGAASPGPFYRERHKAQLLRYGILPLCSSLFPESPE